ncbi:MAG: hypothetical protein ABR573_10065 [Candidatus Dormibacteria bacterium]
MNPAAITWGDTSAGLVVWPERGRVLQGYAGGHSIFWTATSTDGWNVGGERLWLGPEAAWFWRRAGSVDIADHEVQAAMDPGTWRVAGATSESWRAEQDATVRRLADGAAFRVRGHRNWSIFAPSRGAGFGYRTTTELEVEGPAGQPISLWTLAQVPAGGLAMVSTAGTAPIRSYFGPFPDGAIAQQRGLIRMTVSGKRRWKAGVGPDVATGRMAYVRPVQGGALMLMREFSVDPSLPYPDAPAHADGQGDAVQVFIDDGTYGGFGELEHHGAPGVTCEGTTRLFEEFDTTIAYIAGDDWEDEVTHLLDHV